MASIEIVATRSEHASSAKTETLARHEPSASVPQVQHDVPATDTHYRRRVGDRRLGLRVADGAIVNGAMEVLNKYGFGQPS